MFALARTQPQIRQRAAALIKSRLPFAAAFNAHAAAQRSVGSVVHAAKIEEFQVKNEPILAYKKGSPERQELEEALKRTADSCETIPIIIGGKEYKTDKMVKQVMPHLHGHTLANFYHADEKLVKLAIETATKAQLEWDKVPLEERAKIWMSAADLMSKKYRAELNSATMLGQSKTVIQAEIDSAAEMIDFIRLHVHFLKEAIKYQPISEDAKVTKNSSRFRGLEGFVAAVSPFNFSAIGGNLAYTPALLGNAVLWKPSDTAVLSNWRIFKIMCEAGVPPGVVNFVPADGPVFGDAITQSPDLSGINFTGSVPTFQRLWKQVGNNIDIYKNFPRLIGEVGGKNFHFIHPSAELQTVVAQTIRSAFEFCGQKCSACSRAYIPESLWPKIKEGLVREASKLNVGDVRCFENFMGAVIDDKAFKRITSYIEHAKCSDQLEIISGGTYNDKDGYFVLPTIVVTKDPKEKLMREEIFGPVLTIYVYKDSEMDKAIELVKTTTPFALTGAVFAQDEKFLSRALEEFKYAAGNFYINDKSTGAVVGQQPFGGGRMSGTNDKAGGPQYILRWTSPQSIKETFVPLPDIKYPYMEN